MDETQLRDMIRQVLTEELAALAGQLASRDDAELLTVGEVALEHRCSERTVRRWIRSKRLKATKVGREYRVRRLDLNRMAA